MSKEHDEFIRDVSALLTDKERDIDEHTLSRLRAARLQALDALTERSYRQTLSSLWQPATVGLAFCLTIALIAFRPDQTLPGMEAEALELLAIEDNLDLYEDLEFYQWLLAQESTG